MTNNLTPNTTLDAEITDRAIHAAHDRSFANKDEICASDYAGCFKCLHIYPAHEVTEWVEEEVGDGEKQPSKFTAVCPVCGVDAVLGAISGYPITLGFLNRMNESFF